MDSSHESKPPSDLWFASLRSVIRRILIRLAPASTEAETPSTPAEEAAAHHEAAREVIALRAMLGLPKALRQDSPDDPETHEADDEDPPAE